VVPKSYSIICCFRGLHLSVSSLLNDAVSIVSVNKIRYSYFCDHFCSSENVTVALRLLETAIRIMNSLQERNFSHERDLPVVRRTFYDPSRSGDSMLVDQHSHVSTAPRCPP
jgi:hypothetical protein